MKIELTNNGPPIQFANHYTTWGDQPSVLYYSIAIADSNYTAAF